ncbi:Calcium-dependent protein kinase 28, partial [Mucuna pruriens]
MGICFSTTKVSGSSSNNASASNRNRKCSAAPAPAAEPVTLSKQKSSRGQRRRAAEESQKNPRAKEKVSARRHGGHVPCGKRTDFGYDKDFDKRFSLGKLLGHGQFGYTYVGVDKVNGDRVAVKRLEKSKMVLPIAVEDVKREVKILKELTGHENVVQFYNAFEDDSYVYIVMELCEGGELLDRILANGPSEFLQLPKFQNQDHP